MNFGLLRFKLEASLTKKPYILSKGKARYFKKRAEFCDKERLYELALEFSIKAARIYEELLKKENVDYYLRVLGWCYDLAGKASSIIAKDFRNKDWEEDFKKYAIKFKGLGGDYFLRCALLSKNLANRRENFTLGAYCYERKANILHNFNDFYNAARVVRNSSNLYLKAGKTHEAQWKLAKAMNNLSEFNGVYKKAILRLYKKIKLIARANKSRGLYPYPKNFRLSDLEERIQKALR